MSKYNVEEINELIRNRRSIYPAMYSGEVISDEIISQMIENANWAPTHRLTEPWRFVVFKGDGIQKLATFQSNLYKELTLADNTFDEAKYEKLAKKPMLCSHIISIGMKRDPKASVPEMEELASVAAAVQNMYLTASAYGIGCYWGSGGITYKEEAKSFFGLGGQDKLMGFLYLGIPKGDWPVSRRRPVQDKVSWVSA